MGEANNFGNFCAAFQPRTAATRQRSANCGSMSRQIRAACAATATKFNVAAVLGGCRYRVRAFDCGAWPSGVQ